MHTVLPSTFVRGAVAALIALAAGCGQAPLARPDTAALGAGAAPGRCELQRIEALRAVNAARASARRCGDRAMSAAPPLQWNQQLYWAADLHARDMARKDYLEHRDPGGDSVRERVRAQNYPWRHVGENIAGGTDTLEHTVEAWLESPSHCENLMEPDYRDVGLACAERTGTEYDNYWALVMARR